MFHTPVRQLIAPRRLGKLLEIPPPTLDLDFVGRPSMTYPGLPPITFTRASSATHVDASGVVATVAADVPRFSHDPLTGARRGLLIEEERTNLCLRSEEIDNASWTKARSAVTANDHTAPDGAATMDLLTEDTTASNTHQAQQGVTVSNSTVYCLSAFLKKKDRHFCLGVGTANVIVAFNLDTGVAAASFGTVVASGVMPYPNGVYRCWFSFTTTSTSETILLMLASAATIGGRIYNGDGASGSWAWGVVLEQGAFPTSYIKTEDATAARAADVATLGVSPWLNTLEGTLLAEVAHWPGPRTASEYGIASISDGSFAHDIEIVSHSGGGVALRLREDPTGVVAAWTGGATLSAGGWMRAAVAWRENDARAAVKGTLTALDTSCAVPTGLTTLYIGAAPSGSPRFNGSISRIAYWPHRLPDAMLQGVTA